MGVTTSPGARLLIGLLLGGCATDDKLEPCPPESTRNPADGLCYLDDRDTGEPHGDEGMGDGSDGGTGEDGADGGSGDEGADGGSGDEGSGSDGGLDCSPPDVLAGDPVRLVDEVDVQRSVFAELVDLEIDLETDTAYAVGQGGLMRLELTGGLRPTYSDRTAVPDELDRFYMVELGPPGAVYVTNRDIGIFAVDTSDPTQLGDPVGIDELGFSGMARVGELLFATVHTGELVTFDISDPLVLTEVDRIAGLGNPWRPVAAGDRLYVADNTVGVGVVDISSPETPVLVGTAASSGGVQDLDLSSDGSTLYTASGGVGVEIWSLDDPDAPELLSALPLGYSVISLAVDGDQLWAVNQQDVVAIDISDPREPVVLNTHRTRQWSMTVEAVGGRAYVGDWAWFEIFEAGGSPVPVLDPTTTTLYMPDAGATKTVELANLGSVPLTISDWGTDAAGVELSIDTTEVPAGGSATLTITAPEGVLDHQVCVASNDPDEPVQTIQLLSSDSDGRGVGIPAPDFTLLDLDGNTHRLSDQEGVPVVLAYFATW